MATLSTRRRNRLRDQSFAIPETRSYPIHNRRHAANALARVAQHGSPAQRARVRRAVCRRFPTLPTCQDR